MELNGAVGILTGASRGLGAELAERLAARGVNLALAARSEEDLEITAKKARRHGVRVLAERADVADAGDLENLVDETIEELGPLDLLINNAGIERPARFETYGIDEIQAMVTTNLTSAAILSRLVAPGMIERGRGHIVNISSLGGKTAYPYNSLYSATKHGLVGLSWSLREELKPHGIGVSVVCPGQIRDAGMFYSRHPDHKTSPLLGTVALDKVATAAIKAIEKNRAEIIVTPGLGRIVDVMEAISHDLTAAVQRRLGIYRYLEGDVTDE